MLRMQPPVARPGTIEPRACRAYGNASRAKNSGLAKSFGAPCA
ncbi:hypothetical protein A2U01_0018716 [Trifolium medium]|uniref:Uncharacterized protein n=1 Tax=Trifolium medium TaxID=97028 RepID=A0A392ND24_9FABA|nr:hypothetical protein [Trifolium medium]